MTDQPDSSIQASAIADVSRVVFKNVHDQFGGSQQAAHPAAWYSHGN